MPLQASNGLNLGAKVSALNILGDLIRGDLLSNWELDISGSEVKEGFTFLEIVEYGLVFLSCLGLQVL